MQPEPKIDPLSAHCMAITSIIDAALALNLITEEEHSAIHTATWNARINAGVRQQKAEAA
jgi:hypothetical protein